MNNVEVAATGRRSEASPHMMGEAVVEGSRAATSVHFDTQEQLDDWLSEIIALNTSISRKLNRGWDPIQFDRLDSGSTPSAEFRVKDVVGWITAATKSHCVLPKFLREEPSSWSTGSQFLARYLSFSFSNRYGLLESYTGVEARPKMGDLFAAAFLAAMEPAFRSGLARGYQERKEYANRIAGRVLPEEYGKSVYQRPELVPQVVDRLQEDIPLNRLLGWTVRTLLRLPLSSVHVGRLFWLEEMFAELPETAPTWRAVEELSLTPAQYEYTDAVELAKVLYRGNLTTPGHGQLGAANFVFLGWHVFQEFVAALLARLQRRIEKMTSSRGKLTLAVSQHRGLRDVDCYPDFQIDWQGSRLLLDAKYKLDGPEPSADDASQVIAAGIAVNADAVGLVYPSARSGRRSAPHRWRVRRGRVSLPLYRLEVDPRCVQEGDTPEREVGRLEDALNTMAP